MKNNMAQGMRTTSKEMRPTIIRMMDMTTRHWKVIKKK
jgi:hypothetical protein